uniref:Phosphoribosylamine-glycine ligase n=1 Tax=Ditylenchus dipsaci TaxID=166011 RepID=A0A915DVH4_9BILA
MGERNNVLVLGSGAREHAIAWKLDQSDLVDKVYIAPGNACKYSIAEEIPHLNDINAVRKFCISHRISLVVIGPEQQICEGWASQLEDVCAHVLAPSHRAAQLEASKTFAKGFMISNGLPTAQYATFHDLKTASDFVNRLDWTKIVVKEDGLCAGKGVSIAENKQEAIRILTFLFHKTQNLIL